MYIIDAIIAMSKHLDFNVIAEGIETHHQANTLTERDIDGMQGFLYAKPMYPNNLLHWVDNQNQSQRFL